MDNQNLISRLCDLSTVENLCANQVLTCGMSAYLSIAFPSATQWLYEPSYILTFL